MLKIDLAGHKSYPRSLRPERRHPNHQLDLCLGTFSRLKQATARQVLEFQRKRGGENPLGESLKNM
jgi:hypothetical protein